MGIKLLQWYQYDYESRGAVSLVSMESPRGSVTTFKKISAKTQIKEFKIVKILIILILMKIFIGDQHLGTNEFSILFIDFFILSLDRNLLFQF